jgi:hypothetical protein
MSRERRNAPGSPISESYIGDYATGSARNEDTVNASGHRDQLKRQYSLMSALGLAISVDNAWLALGSSISISIRESKTIPKSGARAIPHG